MELSPVIWNIVLTAVIVLMVRAPANTRQPGFISARCAHAMRLEFSRNGAGVRSGETKQGPGNARTVCVWLQGMVPSSPTRCHPPQTPQQLQSLPTPTMASMTILDSPLILSTRSPPIRMLAWCVDDELHACAFTCTHTATKRRSKRPNRKQHGAGHATD